MSDASVFILLAFIINNDSWKRISLLIYNQGMMVTIVINLVFPRVIWTFLFNDYIKFLLHLLMPFNVELDYGSAGPQLNIVLRIVEYA